MGIADDLQQLSDLFERGLLTREQFDAAKARLLGIEPDAEAPTGPTVVQPVASPPTEDRTIATARPVANRATVSDRMRPLVSFVSENRIPAAVAGAVVLLLLVATLARPSEPPRPTAAPPPSPEAQLQNTITRCITNLGSWIDEFERNYERVYRTFGVQSLEARAIAELSNEYYTRSFQVGADRAIEEVHPKVIGVCSSDPEFADRIARFAPN